MTHPAVAAVLEWSRSNRWGIVAAFVLMGGVLGAGLVGCSPADVVRVRIPPKVAASLGVPNRVTLRQATGIWEDWKDYVANEAERRASENEAWVARMQRSSDEFGANLDVGWQWAGFLDDVLQVGLGSAQTTAESSGIPLLPSLLSGLSLIVGATAFRRPGDKRREDQRVAKAEKDAYRGGGRHLMKRLLDAGVDVPGSIAAEVAGARPEDE